MRVLQLWERVRDSLWFVPSLFTLAASVFAHLMVAFDRRVADDLDLHEYWWAFGVGSEGARATLSAIAQSVITVTGVVFSVTIVALQLAASQFTPRVLRTFLADRGNQWVLAIFIGTFTYTILVERTVGSPPGGDDAFVPSISVTVAVLLMLVSIGALIYFVNHIAQSIRASVIVTNVAGDARKLVDDLFPEMLGEVADDAGGPPPPDPSGAPWVIRARSAGYVESVDEKALFSIAEQTRLTIRMEPQVGQFVLPGEPIASVWFDEATPDGSGREKVEKKIRYAIILGSEWTLQQDLERALVELSDIAVRALSPSLNDPTTATLCVDRLGEILTLLGGRRFPSPYRQDRSGRVRFIARPLAWERAVDVAFEKIRLHGARAPAVIIRLIQVCGRVGTIVPPTRREPLRNEIRKAMDDARRDLADSVDLERAERAAEEAMNRVDEHPGEQSTRSLRSAAG